MNNTKRCGSILAAGMYKSLHMSCSVEVKIIMAQPVAKFDRGFHEEFWRILKMKNMPFLSGILKNSSRISYWIRRIRHNFFKNAWKNYSENLVMLMLSFGTTYWKQWNYSTSWWAGVATLWTVIKTCWIWLHHTEYYTWVLDTIKYGRIHY